MPRAIRVTREPLYTEPISPLIYGDFVELLNDLVPGMRSEKIQDRRFYGVARPGCVYPPGQDWGYPRWEAFVTGQPAHDAMPDSHDTLDAPNVRVQFELDESNPYVGNRCARIEVEPDPVKPFVAGIAQTRLAVKAGETLQFEVYLRSEKSTTGRVRVLLGRQYGVFFRAYASLTFDGVSDSWERYEGEMTPDATDENATLVIGLLDSRTLWVDNVSLMSVDNLRGWRPDVVEAIRALNPGVLRFGGSSLIFYQWESGIGPRDRRVPFVNRPWGNVEDNDVGIHEFLDLCELVGAEPLICLNSNSTTIEQVLDEIEYCNGPADTPYGRRRAEAGRAEPFRVRYWQIGNEQSGDEYERILLEYARAIRARYPELVLLASYPSENILTRLSDDVDYVSPHFYSPHTPEREAELRQLIETIRERAKNPLLKLAVTEWNHTAGSWGWGRSWLLTLYNALNAGKMLNMFHRLGDVVRIANRSNMTNSCCSGILQTNGSALFVTPCYHVQRAYANLSGDRALTVETAPDDSLDVSATLRTDTGEVALFVVNGFNRTENRTVSVDSMGVRPRSVEVWSLTGGSLTDVNSALEPNRVSPVESTVAVDGPVWTYGFPPFSVTILRFPTA
jgi:alpha-N-arabinofuranosidase